MPMIPTHITVINDVSILVFLFKIPTAINSKEHRLSLNTLCVMCRQYVLMLFLIWMHFVVKLIQSIHLPKTNIPEVPKTLINSSGLSACRDVVYVNLQVIEIYFNYLKVVNQGILLKKISYLANYDWSSPYLTFVFQIFERLRGWIIIQIFCVCR